MINELWTPQGSAPSGAAPVGYNAETGKKVFKYSVLLKAKDKFGIEVIVTGAIKSVYQASRVQKICDELNLECFNPLWNKDELEYLNDLINAKFKVIIIGVAAYPLDKSWLGKEINQTFVEEARKLNREYQIHLAGEGGEFETFVLDCPLFKKPLEVKSFKDFKEGEYTWSREVKV